MNGIKEILKSIGGFVLGVIVLAAFFILVDLFLYGSAWLSTKVLPILNLIVAGSFFILLLIGFPLSFFRKCREWCAAAFLYWSYFCGLSLWMFSLLVTLNLWGVTAVIIGLIFAGVGILPVALLACIFKGEWSTFFQLLLQLGLVIGCRLFAFYLRDKAEQEAVEPDDGASQFKLSMTLQDAEKIVQEYGSVLESESTSGGTAFYASRLSHSPERIVQAMKLWLAHEIQNRSLNQEFRNEIGTAASRLPFFVEDGEAHRINATSHDFSPAERAKLSTEDFIAQAKVVGEVVEWTTNAHIAGSSLRGELSDFIAAVEQFDPTDSLFWQRVYTLLPPTKSNTVQNSTHMTTLKQILRWLAVLPGAMLAVIIVMFPIHWAAMIIYYFGGAIFGVIISKEGGGSLMSLESLEGFMDALFVLGTFIAVAARIAPRFHFVTAVVVALLPIGFLSFFYAEPSFFGLRIADSSLMGVVHIILCFTSVIFALFYARGLDTATGRKLSPVHTKL